MMDDIIITGVLSVIVAIVIIVVLILIGEVITDKTWLELLDDDNSDS